MVINVKYYVATDLHAYLGYLKDALKDAGYYDDDEEKKIIICGDLFDRGNETQATQDYILRLLKRNEVILIRGNHEDLFVSLVTKDNGRGLGHHLSNGTFITALELSGCTLSTALDDSKALANAAKKTPFFEQIIPQMLDYYETEHYIFVHGWIPCKKVGEHLYEPWPDDWRKADIEAWSRARWINGMDAARSGVVENNKTIVCGHFHASYGHAKFENKGSEFGEGADFSPFYGPGIIALDACTALSGRINVIVLED